MIYKKATYRIISFAFLVLFLSFIVTPTVIVSLIDEDVDITMVFAFVEEETKETKEKKSTDSDEALNSSNPLMANTLFESKAAKFYFCKTLFHTFCPGEVAPPPELS